MPTIEDAVDALLTSKKQSPNRLALLAGYLVERFQGTGLKLAFHGYDAAYSREVVRSDVACLSRHETCYGRLSA